MGNPKVANIVCFLFYFETAITYLVVGEESSPWSPVLRFSRMIIIVY